VGAEYSFPNSASNAGTLLMLRNALVLEELKDDVETGDIFLLRGAPRAWLRDGKQIRAEGLATYFGDISLQADCRKDAASVTVEAPARRPYRRLLLSLRRPDRKTIRSVRVNGGDHGDFTADTVTLASGPKTFAVEVRW
jgi:hypothetical protein